MNTSIIVTNWTFALLLLLAYFDANTFITSAVLTRTFDPHVAEKSKKKNPSRWTNTSVLLSELKVCLQYWFSAVLSPLIFHIHYRKQRLYSSCSWKLCALPPRKVQTCGLCLQQPPSHLCRLCSPDLRHISTPAADTPCSGGSGVWWCRPVRWCSSPHPSGPSSPGDHHNALWPTRTGHWYT